VAAVGVILAPLSIEVGRRGSRAAFHARLERQYRERALDWERAASNAESLAASAPRFAALVGGDETERSRHWANAFREFVSAESERADRHAELKQKYAAAMWLPWASIPLDPPSP